MLVRLSLCFVTERRRLLSAWHVRMGLGEVGQEVPRQLGSVVTADDTVFLPEVVGRRLEALSLRICENG